MKTNQILGGLVAVLTGATAFAADPITSMEWQFGTSDNPSTVKPPPADNPFDGTGMATISKGEAGTGYWSGTFLEGIDSGYGTKTGLWDIGGTADPGGVQLGIDLYPTTPSTLLGYTLTLDQFVSSGNFPYALEVSFSLSQTPTINSTVLENAANGQWVETVYTWSGLSVNGPLGLTISAESGKGLLLDRVMWNVSGNLSAIPEPTVTQLGVMGLAILGFLSWRRGKSAA